MKKKVFNSLLFWSVPLLSLPQKILDRSIAGSPIIGLQTYKFLMYELRQSIFGTIPVLQDKLADGTLTDNPQLNLSWKDITDIEPLLRQTMKQIRKTPEYSHVPELSISLKGELDQLGAFLSEAKQLTNTDKAAKYASMKPTLKQIVARVNEAIQEAVKETVYSSDEIEQSYIKLVQIGDVMGLDLSEELSQEVMFDSKTLQSDGRKEMYSTLIELRNALARDEELMTPLVEVRSRLGTVYRLSFPDYERVRTEAHYVLKLVRQKMGWNESHLDYALTEIKALIEEMYQFPIKDWKDMIPEIPWAHFKNMRSRMDKDQIKHKINCERSGQIELSYKLGNNWIAGFQLEKSLAEKWITLCEIFETVYEKEPNEKAEELYKFLFILGEFNLFYYSKQFLFFPWFDPMLYTRRCRMLHANLHFFKSAVYGPKGTSFGYDMMHNISECVEESKKENLSIYMLNEAANRVYYELITRWGAMSCFFIPSDPDKDEAAVGLGCYFGQIGRTLISIFRMHQYEELCLEKARMTEYELPFFKHIEKKVELMLDALNYRHDIISLIRLWEMLDSYEESKTS